MALLNLRDYEAAAREILSQATYDYYAGGADDELTVTRNHRAYDELHLHYRVLRDASRRDLTTTVLGHTLDLPILFAPTAFQRLAHPDGELATARAASAAGTVMILSTMATTAVEEVVDVGAPTFFQLYIFQDRGVTAALVDRAKEAGCKALVLTVDAPLCGNRERDVRNGFHLPPHLQLENLLPAGREALPAAEGDSGLAAYITSQFDEALTWNDVDWLVEQSGLPVLVKGIVHPEDAVLAVRHGAAGVVVSNHGGRQLDTAPATLEVLPRIVDAVGDTTEVLVDGGIRRGTDVLKALALGARAVLIGRPVLWGLAVDGQAGVEAVLDILRRELDTALGLCGCRDLLEVGRELLG